MEKNEKLTLDKVFEDKVSGKSVERPQLKAMLEFVREGDTVVIHSLDRLARNLDDLRRLVNDLTGRGVRVQFIKENLMFSGDDSSMSKLLLSIMGAFAEFERALIKERQMEGIKIAKAEGAYKGRKLALNNEQAAELKNRAERGEKITKIAKDYRISRYTVYKYLER